MRRPPTFRLQTKCSATPPPAPNLNADVKRSNRDARETYEASRLEPSERDMQRAREERSKRVDTGKVTKYRSEYGTIIEETHDQNNRVTDVRVTPGSTEIPYTMKNRSDRPVDNRPGADPRSTLDTPKFIEFQLVTPHGRLYDSDTAGGTQRAP